jgi:hypothetical protein
LKKKNYHTSKTLLNNFGNLCFIIKTDIYIKIYNLNFLGKKYFIKQTTHFLFYVFSINNMFFELKIKAIQINFHENFNKKLI